MKPKTLLCALSLLVSGLASAQNAEIKERVISDAVFPMTVRLDESTVKCSAADYSLPALKILVPKLAEVTLFNHRNIGEGAPCVAAGACTDQLNPSSILDLARPNEEIQVRVLLTAVYVLNHAEKTCNVLLREDVFTPVRGVDFYHQRDGVISERLYEDCLGL